MGLAAIILKEDTPRGKTEMPIPGRYLLFFPANKGKRGRIRSKNATPDLRVNEFQGPLKSLGL